LDTPRARASAVSAASTSAGTLAHPSSRHGVVPLDANRRLRGRTEVDAERPGARRC
jgi:hypothetical protein